MWSHKDFELVDGTSVVRIDEARGAEFSGLFGGSQRSIPEGPPSFARANAECDAPSFRSTCAAESRSQRDRGGPLGRA